MATPQQVQDQLDGADITSKRHAQIINAFEGASKTDYFVVGDVDAAGSARPVQCNTADSAATQAAAILAGLALG
jgi:hypothetical protein